jgi:hypothetical protein
LEIYQKLIDSLESTSGTYNWKCTTRIKPITEIRKYKQASGKSICENRLSNEEVAGDCQGEQ